MLGGMIDWSEKPVAALIRHVDQRTSQAAETIFARQGGSRPIYFILLALHEEEINTQRELAAAVDIREATLSHHLRTMTTMGLIERSRHAGNRRAQHIHLTGEGRTMYGRLREAIRDFDAHVRRSIGDDEDVARFFELGPRIAAAADEYMSRDD